MYKCTYQLATPIQIMKQKNRFELLDTHMGHIFMKYVLLSFFKHTPMFKLVDIKSWGKSGDKGTHKQVNLVKKEAKIKNRSQITKFLISKKNCSLLKVKERKNGAKPLRRSD